MNPEDLLPMDRFTKKSPSGPRAPRPAGGPGGKSFGGGRPQGGRPQGGGFGGKFQGQGPRGNQGGNFNRGPPGGAGHTKFIKK